MSGSSVAWVDHVGVGVSSGSHGEELLNYRRLVYGNCDEDGVAGTHRHRVSATIASLFSHRFMAFKMF